MQDTALSVQNSSANGEKQAFSRLSDHSQKLSVLVAAVAFPSTAFLLFILHEMKQGSIRRTVTAPLRLY